MWSDRLAHLQARQGYLVARSHALRERLAHEAQPLQRPFAIADHVRDGARWLIAHPWWIAAAVALPIAVRPGRAAGWVVKLWGGWRVWRRVQPFLAHLGR
jgi:hypothetical protein